MPVSALDSLNISAEQDEIRRKFNHPTELAEAEKQEQLRQQRERERLAAENDRLKAESDLMDKVARAVRPEMAAMLKDFLTDQFRAQAKLRQLFDYCDSLEARGAGKVLNGRIRSPRGTYEVPNNFNLFEMNERFLKDMKENGMLPNDWQPPK